MTNLLLSLQITLIGMGLVFGAILMLWALMILLTAVIRDKQPAPAQSGAVPSAGEAPQGNDELKAMAAATAVTLALAHQGSSTAHPLSLPPTALISAWQLGMRTRQMTQKGTPTKKEKR